MKLVLVPIVVSMFGIAADVQGQRPATADSSDIHYYDRWPGVWHRIEGDRMDSLPTFEVRRGPGNSFLESWYLVIDDERSPSFGLRSWDPATETWRLVWVAEPDLFQIWDGIKLENGWYIVRRFGEEADTFLSRQAWIPQGPDRLLRTIERSTDGGRTWNVRYRDLYQRAGSSVRNRRLRNRRTGSVQHWHRRSQRTWMLRCCATVQAARSAESKQNRCERRYPLRAPSRE